jgi:hypothetical protein
MCVVTRKQCVWCVCVCVVCVCVQYVSVSSVASVCVYLWYQCVCTERVGGDHLGEEGGEEEDTFAG